METPATASIDAKKPCFLTCIFGLFGFVLAPLLLFAFLAFALSPGGADVINTVAPVALDVFIWTFNTVFSIVSLFLLSLLFARFGWIRVVLMWLAVLVLTLLGFGTPLLVIYAIALTAWHLWIGGMLGDVLARRVRRLRGLPDEPHDSPIMPPEDEGSQERSDPLAG